MLLCWYYVLDVIYIEKYFLRVIPTSWQMIWHVYSDIPTGIRFGFPSGILFGIYSGILSDIYSGKNFGIYVGSLFGIYPHICYTILSEIAHDFWAAHVFLGFIPDFWAARVILMFFFRE